MRNSIRRVDLLAYAERFCRMRTKTGELLMWRCLFEYFGMYD